MLLSFPNRDHADVLAGEGCLHIGGSSDNDVVLAPLRDRHARLTLDARGIVLEILDAGARAHVNARPVREKAFVRYGDTVCLDAVTIAVSEPDRLDDPPAPSTGARAGIALRGVLRGMSGSTFGKSFPLTAGVVIGEHVDGSIALGSGDFGTAFARIDNIDGEPLLVSNEAGGSTVNGRRCGEVRLRNGDQLMFGRERFLVECCTVPTPPMQLPVMPPATTEAEAESVDVESSGSAGHAVWWLIAAAAAIGLMLAAALRLGA